ncbi:hypothetical protein N656DRAFT_61832 [Canariomyces notabilis]|uniref:Uncharacterized protein n=1 Tax=Canariomyces notabilis TaxID=2074819 RepID=A0AAN6TNN2_9PEZI|nr:hypothetical protein N656DRAFT_61832 [Canariomyces arenarius]
MLTQKGGDWEQEFGLGSVFVCFWFSSLALPHTRFFPFFLVVSFRGSCINIQRSSAPASSTFTSNPKKGPRRAGLPPLISLSKEVDDMARPSNSGYGTQADFVEKSFAHRSFSILYLRSSGRRDVHLKGRLGMGLGCACCLTATQGTCSSTIRKCSTLVLGWYMGGIWASRSAQKG